MGRDRFRELCDQVVTGYRMLGVHYRGVRPGQKEMPLLHQRQWLPMKAAIAVSFLNRSTDRKITY